MSRFALESRVFTSRSASGSFPSFEDESVPGPKRLTKRNELDVLTLATLRLSQCPVLGPWTIQSQVSTITML